MNKQDLQAVRTFLEGLDYQIVPINYLPNPPYWLYSHASEDTWLGKVNSENEAFIAALSHYLSQQLGVHWRRTAIEAQLYIHQFDGDLERQIKQAIAYIQALEKGETE